MATDLSALTEEELLALEKEEDLASESQPAPTPEPELFARPLVGLPEPSQEVVEEAPAPQQYYELELPDFSFVNVPVGTSEEDALRGARASFPEAFASESIEEEKEGGFFSSLYGGLIGSIESIPGGAQAVYGGVTGDSEVFEGAKARVARAEEAARQATGKVITLDDVSQTYDDEGLISATAKWLGLAAETTGQSIGYMAPSMLGGFMLGRMGTVAGAMLGGPLGAAVGAGAGTLLGRGLGALNTSAKAYKAASIGLSVGRTIGYTGTQVSNFLASNLSRSVEAAEARGEELTENDYNVLGELSIAGGQTALESMMVLLAGGSLVLGAGAKAAVGKAALTPPGKRVLMESLANQINKIDNLSPLKRFVATMVEETVAEVGQQALERLSAGESISPTEEDALQEYIQTALMAIGPSMFFGGVGAVNAKVQQSKQIKHDESIEQARDDMLLVQKGLAKQAEEEQASQLEEAAVAKRDSFLQRVLPTVLGGRDESDPGGRTTEDVHNAARSRNINSEDAGFHAFTRRLVGKSKLDELTPSELEEVYQVLELMPVQKLPISFPVASKDDAVNIAIALEKPTLTDENLLDALDSAGLLGVDRRYVTKEDLAEIADSYRNRLNELGLVKAKSGVIGPTIDLEKAEALAAAIASPKVKRTIPQADYEAVIKYAGLKNEGYFPSWEKFSELTGVLNTDFYELAIAEAVARGDVAGDGTLRITHPATPSARKRKFSVYVKAGGGERRSIGVFNTRLEGEEAAKAHRAEAAATRRRGQGPAGVPELSMAEVGNVYSMNVIEEMLPTVGDSTPRPESEMVERYDYDVRERKEWVVKDKQGNLLGAYPTRKQAVDKVNEVKDASPNKRKANVKNPSKETVYRVHESEIGETSKRATRSRQVGTESYLVKSGAEAKANQLRDKSSGAARFYGTQANDDTAGLRGDDVLTPEEITELTNDPVGFAEKRFPVQDVVYGPEENPVKTKLLASVNKYLSEVRGLKNIQVAVVDTINGDANAEYNSVLELMTVALDGEAFQTDLPLEKQINEVNKFVNHELIHYALRAGLISNAEYQVLVRLAAGTEVKPSELAATNRDRAADGLEPISADTTYDELAEGIYREQANNEGWIPDDMSEESISFMAQDYGDDRSSVPAEAGTIFRRIGLGLSKLRNALQGAGFRSSDQVYSVLFGKEFANRLAASKVRDAYWYRRRNSPEYKSLVEKIVENRGTLTEDTERRLVRAGVFDPVPSIPLPVALDTGEEAESTARQSRKRTGPTDITPEERAKLKSAAVKPSGPVKFRTPEGWLARVLRKVNRKNYGRKYRTGTGHPNNKRKTVTLRDGSQVTLGKQRPQDWAARVSSVGLSDQEIRDFRAWYSEVDGLFLSTFGSDAPLFTAAWLMAQQNASPPQAMNNMLRVREQLINGLVGKKESKKGGVAHKRLVSFWSEVLAEGVDDLTTLAGSQKLYDFVDSAMGKDTRTWMGDDARAGQPAVIDVHTARDAGLVDETFRDRLIKLGANKRAMMNLEIDLKGAPTESQYERQAEYMHEVMDYLNDNELFGGGFERVAEVQALGWMSLLTQTGMDASSSQQAIDARTFQISSEAVFGEGAPLADLIGDIREGLSNEDIIGLTHNTVFTAMKEVWEDLGNPPLLSADTGLGSWMSEQNASTQLQFMASDEVSFDVANALGYLLQQTEVWSGRPLKMTRGGAWPSGATHWFVDVTAPDGSLDNNESITELFALILRQSGLSLGYSPIDGGFRMYVDRKGDDGNNAAWGIGNGAKAQAALNRLLIDPIEDAASRVAADVDVEYHPGLVQQARNNWKEESSGQSYLSRFETRPEFQQVLRDARGAVEETVRSEISRRKGQSDQRRRSASEGSQEYEANHRRIGLLGDDGNPIALDDLHQGTGVSDSTNRAVYRSMGLEIAPGQDTNQSLQIYPLQTVFSEDPSMVEAQLYKLLDRTGWSYRVFGPGKGENGRAYYPDFQDPNTPSYDDKVVWIFDPSNQEGSFRDEAYTLAWRVTHEIAHAITNGKLTEKYGGKGRRAGAMGKIIRGPHYKQDSERSLAEAMRAVEWEHESFIVQRKILEEEFGIEISQKDFNRENSINMADAVVRALTGQFGSPGDIGIVPTDINPDQVLANAVRILRVLSDEITGDRSELIVDGTTDLSADANIASSSVDGTARRSLKRQNFKRDPSQDSMASPLDREKPTLPPYKPVPQSRDPQRLMNALSWGNVRFNGNGQYSGKGPGLRVFIAAGSEANFGERHIERHNKDIADNTPYPNAEEFLTGFFDALKSAPKNLEGSYITPYYDAFGRKLNFFWDDPGFSSPGVVVMEYADGPGTYLAGPRYNVITAYADTNFTENSHNESFASGVRRGKYADVRSVMEFERYSQGKRGKQFIKNREKINEAKGFTGRRSVNRRSINTPAQQQAVDAYMGTGRTAQPVHNKSYLGSIISGLTQNYSIPFWEEFRYRMVDQYNGVAVNQSAANRKRRADGKLGLTIPEMAAMSAHSMMMMTDKAGAFVESMLKYGTIDFTGLAGQEWMYGTVTINEMGMENSVEDALVFVPGEGIKRVSFNEPNLYSGTGGFIKILEAINSLNDSLLEKYFTYARAVRAYNKVKEEGKPVPVQFLGENMENALQFGYDHPEIAIAHANLQKWNDSLITFAVKAGVLNEQQAEIWRQYADYVPFYLDTTGEMSDEMRARFKTALGSNDDFKMLNSMLPKAPSKKYKGMTEGELVDPIEATIRNTMAIVSESMKNIASWRFIKNMEVTGDARRLDPNNAKDNEITGNVVTVYENGKSVRFEVTDIFLHDTMVGAFEADKALGSITSAMSIPARLLREGVTRMPDFLLANTTRDAFLSWLLHKTSSDPVSATADSMRRILSDVKNREEGGGATQRAIEMGGGSGGYELKDLDLNKMKKRMDRRLTSSSNPVDALKKTWDLLGDIGNFSESAARQRVFERTYARTQLEFQQQGKEAGLTGDALTKYADRHATGEAAFQAMEVLNFARRGNAPLLRFLTAVVPFLNARIQGLDVFYRNGLLGENSQGLDNDVAKRALMRRASYVAGATLLYTLMHYDDDDFENTEEYRRLDNWLVPLGPLATEHQKYFAIPIPFEAGILLKVLPEALIRKAMGESTGEGLRAVKHSIMNTLAFNPIPQAIKPLVETWANKNSFTNQPIIPEYMLKLDPTQQYRESTSGGAKILGKMAGLSPLQIDSLMKGYLGSSANYINAMLDLVIHRPAFGLTERPQRLVSDMPFIKRFLVDDLGGGNAEDFYRLRDEIDRVVNTVNILKKRDPSRVESFVKSNREVLAARDYAREVGKVLSRIRDRRSLVIGSSMSSPEKGRILRELKRIEIQVMSKPPEL